MTRPLNPPLLGAHSLGDEEVRALEAVVRRGELFRFHASGQMSETDHFETELGNWLGAGAGSVAVNSGTAGLRAALGATGLRPGDRVLVTGFTFVATASAVVSLGARPEPLDVGPRLEVDLDDLRAKLPSARAVVPVYAPGHASNVEDVVDLSHSAGVPVVEDACQALGVGGDGRRAGTVGDLGVYSFQQGKQLCAGEGGAVVSRHPRLLAAARRFTDHGACRLPDGRPSWEPKEAGFGENLRMTELQSAVLRVQLTRLDTLLERQRSLARDLRGRIAACAPLVDSVDPSADSGSSLLLLMKSEEEAEEAVRDARLHRLVLRWVWRQPWFLIPPFQRANLGGSGDDAPRARDRAPRLLSLPVPPLEGEEERAALVEAAGAFFDARARRHRGS